MAACLCSADICAILKISWSELVELVTLLQADLVIVVVVMLVILVVVMLVIVVVVMLVIVVVVILVMLVVVMVERKLAKLFRQTVKLENRSLMHFTSCVF